MKYLIDGEVVDTYGGDFTYMDVRYEIVDGKYIFYKKYYGAWSSDEEVVTDRNEIDEYMKLLIK